MIVEDTYHVAVLEVPCIGVDWVYPERLVAVNVVVVQIPLRRYVLPLAVSSSSRVSTSIKLQWILLRYSGSGLSVAWTYIGMVGAAGSLVP